METEQSDITIGPAKLLGLFFMLVAVCGVFAAIGYSLGKTSAREQALNDKAPLSASLTSPIVGDSTAPKPSAVVPASGSDTTTSQAQPPANSSPNLTFYNAVKQSDRAAQPVNEAPAAPTKATQEIAAPTSVSAIETNAPARAATRSDAKPELVPVASGAFVVQIAAVTREEDAAALAGALRKKNYNVFVVNNPAVHDKFYHVQVGPFATAQDADAMKAKLMGEGYNPIIKRS